MPIPTDHVVGVLHKLAIARVDAAWPTREPGA